MEVPKPQQPARQQPPHCGGINEQHPAPDRQQDFWKDAWKRDKIERWPCSCAALSMRKPSRPQAEHPAGQPRQTPEKSSLSAQPTINQLAQDGWVAVDTVIDEHVVREIIPELKAAGAEGIVEYPSIKWSTKLSRRNKPNNMGSLKKRRKAKINKHKRKKASRANRHKKRSVDLRAQARVHNLRFPKHNGCAPIPGFMRIAFGYLTRFSWLPAAHRLRPPPDPPAHQTLGPHWNKAG